MDATVDKRGNGAYNAAEAEDTYDGSAVYIIRGVNPDTIQEATKHRFHRFVLGEDQDYALIYTGELMDAVQTAHELSDTEIGSLSDGEKQWIADCGYLLSEEYAQVHAEDIERNNQQFLDEFEQELAKAAKQQAGMVRENGK